MHFNSRARIDSTRGQPMHGVPNAAREKWRSSRPLVTEDRAGPSSPIAHLVARAPGLRVSGSWDPGSGTARPGIHRSELCQSRLVQISRALLIRGEPQAVFRWIETPELAKRWQPDVAEYEMTRSTVAVVGTEFREVLRSATGSIGVRGRIPLTRRTP